MDDSTPSYRGRGRGGGSRRGIRGSFSSRGRFPDSRTPGEGRGGGRGRSRGRAREGVKSGFGRPRRDREGDTDMGNEAANKIPQYRSKDNNFLSSNQKTDVVVMVTNLPQGANLEELQSFLQQKSLGFQVSSANMSNDGSRVFFTIPTRHEAMALIKLSGIRFNSSKLAIVFSKNQQGRVTPQAIDFLKEYIVKHYDKANKYLNLSNLRKEEMNVDLNSTPVFVQLVRLLRENCPEIESISIAENNLKHLTGLSDMQKSLPSLVNLNLENNLLRDYKDLDHIKGAKLRQLILRGNPIASSEPSTYRSEVSRRFTLLNMLDEVEVPPVIQFALPQHITNASLPATKGHYFQGQQPLVTAFLKRYFELFDADRQQLSNVYAENACFSLTLNLPPVYGKVDRSLTQPYTGKDRNLVLVKDLDKRESTLSVRRIKVISTLMDLPMTRHNLDSFLVDCFMLAHTSQQIMCVVIHGQFWEFKTEVNRSFDRIMLLGQGATEGWPCIIVNDQLNIRPYSEPVALSSSGSSSGSSSSTATTTTLAMAPTILGEREELVKKLQLISNLRAEYAYQCLEQSAWNYEKALQTFYSLHKEGKLPPTVFQ